MGVLCGGFECSLCPVWLYDKACAYQWGGQVTEKPVFCGALGRWTLLDGSLLYSVYTDWLLYGIIDPQVFNQTPSLRRGTNNMT